MLSEKVRSRMIDILKVLMENILSEKVRSRMTEIHKFSLKLIRKK
jgi:hypothetical protein